MLEGVIKSPGRCEARHDIHQVGAGQYDAVIAMIRDHEHIPVKLLAFKVDPSTGKWRSISGVNVKEDLQILRTPVDHDTAIDIAGQGIASADNLIDACEYAAKPLEGQRRKSL